MTVSPTARFYADSEVKINPDGSMLPPPEMFNIAVNTVQPNVIPSLTADGYRVITTPPELQRRLAQAVAAWQTDKLRSIRQPWEFTGTSHSLISEYENGTAMSHKIQVGACSPSPPPGPQTNMSA